MANNLGLDPFPDHFGAHCVASQNKPTPTKLCKTHQTSQKYIEKLVAPTTRRNMGQQVQEGALLPCYYHIITMLLPCYYHVIVIVII